MRNRLRYTSGKVSRFFGAAAIGRMSDCARKAASPEDAGARRPEHCGTPSHGGAECPSAEWRQRGWDEALNWVQIQCASLLSTTQNNITLHHNTTAGIQRVFLRVRQHLGSHSASLLTTDLEYPGVIALAHESWLGRMTVVELARDVVLSDESGRKERLLGSLIAAYQLTRPDVLYISHVDRTFGLTLPLGEFLAYARALNPRVVTIVDGAQAIGNIDAGADTTFANTDFYVTSGHKWLGGEPTIGVVRAAPAWGIHDPGQAYTRELGSGGTGDLLALRALGVALSEFTTRNGENGRVADVGARNQASSAWLGDELRNATRLRVVAGHNGMVAAWSAEPNTVVRLVQKLRGSNYEVSHIVSERWVLGDQNPPRGERFLINAGGPEPVVRKVRMHDDHLVSRVPDGGVLRLCCHLYHSKKDLAAVARTIVAR